MDVTATLDAVAAWPVDDQLDLVFRLWDRIVDSGWRPTPDAALLEELGRRLAAHDAEFVTGDDVGTSGRAGEGGEVMPRPCTFPKRVTTSTRRIAITKPAPSASAIDYSKRFGVPSVCSRCLPGCTAKSHRGSARHRRGVFLMSSIPATK